MKSIIILLLSFSLMVIVGCSQRPKHKTAKDLHIAYDIDTAKLNSYGSLDSAFRIKKEDILCVYEEGDQAKCIVDFKTDTIIRVEGLCIVLKKGFKIDYIGPPSSD